MTIQDAVLRALCAFGIFVIMASGVRQALHEPRLTFEQRWSAVYKLQNVAARQAGVW